MPAAVDARGPQAGRSAGTIAEDTHTRAAALDGMRAVAVLAVLAFHAGLPWAKGGLLGVDIFFVLSGFLITSLLVREHQERGTVRLKAFWGRRARRLFPALFLLLLGIALFAHLYAGQLDLGRVRADALSTLLFVANWHFIASSQGYFAHAAAPSPLLHMWSLGVEEQYYLVWPLVGLLVLGRFGRRALAWVAGIGAAASALAMGTMYASGVSLDRLYYGTDTRAQTLLVGSCLGALASVTTSRILPPGVAGRRSVRRAVGAVGLVGAVFVLWSCATLNGQEPFLYEGGFLLVALAVAAVIAAVVTLPRSVMSRVCGLRGLVYVGRISYGLYLYHWPLFLAIDHAHTGLGGTPLLALRMAVTFGVSVASFELWERPIRERRLLRGWRAPAGAVTAGALATAAVLSTTVAAAASTSAPTANGPAGTAARPPFTATHPVVSLATGDSLALTLNLGLGWQSERWGVRFVTGSGSGAGVQLGCDLDPNSTVIVGGAVSQAAQGCVDWPQKWARLVQVYDPDVVTVLLGRWEVSDRLYRGHWTHVGNPDFDAHLFAELGRAVRILSARGAEVVLFTMPFVDPSTEAANGVPFPENSPGRVDAYNSLLRKVAAAHKGVASIVDVNRLLDPDGHYTPTVAGVTVRSTDGIHISIAGGMFLRPRVLPTLADLGLTHDESRSRARPKPG
ncbi:MAG TPA: acyltransferase family protein [Acidimicrobiales bacterium]|nr:acyltransferase family protein [Acidimicrobiales bacterium]HLN43693.1 acyltransferase family protein [Acidimicrobiales bacterium]